MHALITDHNGDPRCQCGWAPKPDASGIVGQLHAATKIRKHSRAWRLDSVTGTGPNEIKTYWFTRPVGTHTALDARPAQVFWAGATR